MEEFFYKKVTLMLQKMWYDRNKSLCKWSEINPNIKRRERKLKKGLFSSMMALCFGLCAIPTAVSAAQTEDEIVILYTNDIHTYIDGEISYSDLAALKSSYNKVLLLDALEWGAREAGNDECGGFLQVSGLTNCIDTSIENTTQKDDKDVWVGGPTGEYRVHDVKIYNKETCENK